MFYPFKNILDLICVFLNIFWRKVRNKYLSHVQKTFLIFKNPFKPTVLHHFEDNAETKQSRKPNHFCSLTQLFLLSPLNKTVSSIVHFRRGSTLAMSFMMDNATFFSHAKIDFSFRSGRWWSQMGASKLMKPFCILGVFVQNNDENIVVELKSFLSQKKKPY